MVQEVEIMKEKTNHLYVDSHERKIILHSHLDKVAKSMRKEDASMSNCNVIALINQKGGVESAIVIIGVELMF